MKRLELHNTESAVYFFSLYVYMHLYFIQIMQCRVM